jgi:hypothetical protein
MQQNCMKRTNTKSFSPIHVVAFCLGIEQFFTGNFYSMPIGSHLRDERNFPLNTSFRLNYLPF